MRDEFDTKDFLVGPVFQGRAFAQAKLTPVRSKVEQWQAQHAWPLTVVSIYPQEDEASVLYTNLKKKDAARVGIRYQTVPLSLRVGRHAWLRAVMAANQDEKVQAILVQKPSRSAYETYAGQGALDFSTWWQNIAETIDPAKDIDGLAPLSLFSLEKLAEHVSTGQQPPLENLERCLLPATAQAVIDIALSVGNNDVSWLRQQNIAVIGRSVIVGRPAAAGLTALGSEVKLLSSQHDLSQELPECDIIVSATGQSGLIAGSWVKPGSILIDVGAPTAEFQAECYERASVYTPVPYGVGPVTRACLLENIFKLVSP